MLRMISRGWQQLVGYFMAGLIAILPVALTVAIVAWVTSILKSYLGPQTPLGRGLEALGMRFGPDILSSYFAGLLVVVVALFALGVFVKWGAERFYHQFLDSLLVRVPIIGSLYASLKQLVSMFDQSDETKLKSMSTVFCYFGSRNGSGVLALMPSAEKIRIKGQEYHIIMIPTAPVPFGGGLIFVPAELVEPVDMSVDNLLSVYVSMGVSTPALMRQFEGTKN